MNSDGQVYFDRDEDIPDEDKERLRQAAAEAAYLAELAMLEQKAERARMLNEGGHNGDE
jgi:hypothetical protein